MCSQCIISQSCDGPQTGDALAEYDNQNNPEVSTTETRAITAADSPTDTRLQELGEQAVKDPEYQQLQTVILNGFPSHRQQLPEACRRFWNVREHLSVDDGLIVHGCRLLIPTTMRLQVLSDLHDSHQGSVHTKQRARLRVYWPGIDNDIDNIILSCHLC